MTRCAGIKLHAFYGPRWAALGLEVVADGGSRLDLASVSKLPWGFAHRRRLGRIFFMIPLLS